MNGELARTVVTALMSSDLPEPELALAFGDVLASWTQPEVTAPRRAVQAAATAAQLMPAHKTTSRIRATEVTLVGAGHDDRSSARLRPIQERLKSLGAAAELWLPGHDRNLPHWSARVRGSSRSRLCWAEARQVWETTHQVAAQHRVPEPFRSALARWMCVQHARFRFFERSVDWARAKVLVADYDRGLAGSPSVLAARRNGVSTFTLLHGDPHPVGYVPFSAENVLCWSGHQARVLRAWAGDGPRFHVVGSHWIPSRHPPRKPGNTSRALVVQTGSADLPTFLEAQGGLLRALERKGFTVRVRPHAMSSGRPAEAAGTFHLSRASLAQDLDWADWVFCDSSSVSLEAVVAGCAVAVPVERRLRLASLEGASTVLDAGIPALGWLRLGTATDDWPFAAVGDESLTLTTKLLLDAG